MDAPGAAAVERTPDELAGRPFASGKRLDEPALDMLRFYRLTLSDT